jgi:hypothetical protein
VKPVCVPCQRFFRVKKSGFYFIEGMPKPGLSSRAAPGTSEPEKWEPYKMWVGDEWECKGCGAIIVSGFGQKPIAEHYQDGFAETVKKFGANQLQVNDC